MRKVEKIALCATMSLGMLYGPETLIRLAQSLTVDRIAIISAVRTSWMNRPIMHVHDEYYMCKSYSTAPLFGWPLTIIS